MVFCTETTRKETAANRHYEVRCAGVITRQRGREEKAVSGRGRKLGTTHVSKKRPLARS